MGKKGNNLSFLQKLLHGNTLAISIFPFSEMAGKQFYN